MVIKHSTSHNPNDVVASADWNANHTGTATPEVHGNEAHNPNFLSAESDPVFIAWDKDHADLTNVTSDQHHPQLHNIASHSDTTATGTELNTLTDNSMADTLHRHSELSASDGSPDKVLYLDASGTVNIVQNSAVPALSIDQNGNQRALSMTSDATTKDALQVTTINTTQKSGITSTVNGRIDADCTAYEAIMSAVEWGAGTAIVFGVYNVGSGPAIHVDNQGAGYGIIINHGNSGFGTLAPTEAIDVNSDAIRIRTAQTPASAGATGDAGQICWDAGYVYVCTATNTWRRAALASW